MAAASAWVYQHASTPSGYYQVGLSEGLAVWRGQACRESGFRAALPGGLSGCRTSVGNQRATKREEQLWRGAQLGCSPGRGGAPAILHMLSAKGLLCQVQLRVTMRSPPSVVCGGCQASVGVPVRHQEGCCCLRSPALGGRPAATQAAWGPAKYPGAWSRAAQVRVLILQG